VVFLVVKPDEENQKKIKKNKKLKFLMKNNINSIEKLIIKN
jgi:hypothetical protein